MKTKQSKDNIEKKVAEEKKISLGTKRILQGIVVSDKMKKTIVVRVDHKVRHGAYEKYVLQSKKYKAHDETNSAHFGDRVEIIESKPYSKEKKWALCKIISKSTLGEQGVQI